MKILITAPRGARCGGLRARLENKWSLVAKDANADIEFLEPESHEIHGELLTRLWVTHIRPANLAGCPVLLSEIDFIPVRGAANSRSWSNFTCVPYCTRIYDPGVSPSLSGGRLQEASVSGFPLCAPWFAVFNLDAFASVLDDDWLGASGPFNDAMNLAGHRLMERTSIRPHFLSGKDAFPSIHGVRYPGLGTHCFFARALDEPEDTVICWPDQPRSLTAGQHRTNVHQLLF